MKFLKYIPKYSDLNKIKTSHGKGSSVDFFIYNINTDRIKLSSVTRNLLGLRENEPCTMSTIKSIIIGIDIPKFLRQIEKWLIGNTEGIIHIRIIDTKNQMRTIQIKGRVRYDYNGNIHSVYGAYFDMAHLIN